MIYDEMDKVREIFEHATVSKYEEGHFPATYSTLLESIIQLRGADPRTVNSWLWKIVTHKNVIVRPKVNIASYGRRPPRFKTAEWDDYGYTDDGLIKTSEEDDIDMSSLDADPKKDIMISHGNMKGIPSENGRG